jgi:hypothetical protein
MRITAPQWNLYAAVGLPERRVFAKPFNHGKLVAVMAQQNLPGFKLRSAERTSQWPVCGVLTSKSQESGSCPKPFSRPLKSLRSSTRSAIALNAAR